MILVDTSAWVEFLRDTGTAEATRVRSLVTEDALLACCDPVRMEVLAGARDEEHLRRLRGLLARTQTLPTDPGDYEEAAAIFRACRARGVTVRKLVDCLIAAVALRHGVAVLHRDEDFNAMRAVIPLRIDAA